MTTTANFLVDATLRGAADDRSFSIVTNFSIVAYRVVVEKTLPSFAGLARRSKLCYQDGKESKRFHHLNRYKQRASCLLLLLGLS
jgi:hypothetical protein